MKKIIVAALVVMGVATTAHAAGDAERGQKLSATCAACHGADGNSLAPNFPKLAGQHAAYIEKQLAEFKSGERKDPVMMGQVAGLNAEKMADLAAYYSKQTTKIGSANKKLVDLGEQIYRGGNMESGVAACIACHGPTGAGNPAAKYPKLGGQHAAYTVKALNDFKEGNRANDPNQMMRDVASKMTSAEIKAVAEYISGLY
ncbi:MAG: cytochrome c4 [Gammaproteobacteria bacterium]|nr:cytochrome c4 [Gammaproteobacteria bacterium]